ncbi:hypothetical protein D3C71_1144890 [compost metagenome]
MRVSAARLILPLALTIKGEEAKLPLLIIISLAFTFRLLPESIFSMLLLLILPDELISAAAPVPVVCMFTKPWVLLVELIVPLCSIFPALVITRLFTA